MPATVVATSANAAHGFSKRPADFITLVENSGVAGDAHAGVTVKHRSRVRKDPSQPNLRQVHLIAAELLTELAEAGFAIAPGDLGENLTTRGLALLDLPTGTILGIGRDVELEVTGLRNPCSQIEAFRPGLLARVVTRHENGWIERRAGIMSVVRKGGVVRPGDAISARHPPAPWTPLAPV